MSATIFGSFRLGRDARLVDGQNGKFASLSLAYDTYDSSKGERVPQWISATLNGTRAENLMEYLKKGTLIEAVIADPRLESYIKEEKEAWQLRGHIIKIELLGGKRDGEKPADGGDAGGEDGNPF